MRRDQLEHAIRTACQIIDQPEVIVIGSRAILGTYNEDDRCTWTRTCPALRQAHRRQQRRSGSCCERHSRAVQACVL